MTAPVLIIVGSLHLREEVDILKHLSDAASRSTDPKISAARCHPNILGYMDSWEEDETLYIQTELCSLGNLAHFLWEYGRAFPVLDEARVWKVAAELAAGLRPLANTPTLVLGVQSDILFPVEQQREVADALRIAGNQMVSYYELGGVWGHDTFL